MKVATLPKQIVRIILLLLIIFFVIEDLLGIYYRKHKGLYLDNPYENTIPYGNYNSPFLYTLVFQPTTFYNRNNFLMRRNSNITEKPSPGVTRILSYGDSIALGYEVPTNQTYSQVLESRLNGDNNQQFEVLNMTRGYSPSIYAIYIKNDIIQFKPKKIILEVELTNDTSDEAYIKYTSTDKYNLPNNIAFARYWPGWLQMPPISPKQYFWEKLYTRKFIYDLSHKYGNFMKKYFPNPVFSKTSDIYYYNFGYDKYFLTQSLLDSSFNRMFKIIKGIENYTKDQKVDFLLVILPSRYAYYDNYQYQKGAIRIYNQAVDMANNLKINYVGLYDDFGIRGGSDNFSDFCHPTITGHQIIADAIYNYYKLH